MKSRRRIRGNRNRSDNALLHNLFRRIYPIDIKTISTDDLRRMSGKEGLILQGCGGDLTEWVDGINKLLTENGILLNGTRFENVSVFQYRGATCLLFPFEGVELQIGKFAMWRLQTHGELGGTWLSDFVPNRLNGFAPENEKPDCPLIGQDGNIFNLLGIASRTLREHGQAAQAKEMMDKVYASGSYGEALTIIGEYVNITSSEREVEKKPSVRSRLKETEPRASAPVPPKAHEQQER